MIETSQVIVPSAANKLTQRMPRLPAPTVAEISSQLYAAYTVEGGMMRLAGCTLEPQPIVHAKGRCLKSADGRGAVGEESIELFLMASGDELDAAMISDLGLGDLIAAEKPPRLSDAETERLVEVGRQAIESRCRQLGGAIVSTNELPDGVEIEIVWCRYAAGKLRFAIGEQFVELPFAEWAMRLTPPTFVCSYSRRSTFNLAATDDGRIVAAEEIANCEETGRRMLRGELVTCSATGKHVAPELVETCPVTQQPVLRTAMIACPTCMCRVSPKAVTNDRCQACQEPPAMIKTDSRFAPLLAAYPGLKRWHHWKVANTPQTYLLEAFSVWSRLRVVLEKESLNPLRIARRTRVQRTWTDVPQSKWEEILN